MNIKYMLPQLSLVDSYDSVARNRLISTERLASGLRINSAKDDASNLGVASQVNGKVMAQRAFEQIISFGSSFLSTQEVALNSMSEILKRMLTIKDEADAAILLGKDTSALEEEYMTLQTEFIGITREQFNGEALFASGATNEVQEYFSMDGGRSFETTKYTPVDFKLGNTFKVGETYSVYSHIDHEVNRITWDDAKTEAESLGGHLAVITSETEQNEVMSAIGWAWGGWLGIHKPAGGSWESITGEAVTYTNWFSEGVNPALHYAVALRNDGLWNGSSWTVDATRKAPYYVLEVEKSYSLSDVSVADLESNLQNLSQAIAQNGSEQNRVIRVQKITEANIQNLSEIVARWEEADYAAESASNAKQGILEASSLALLAQANLRSQSMLRLLYARIDKEWEFSSLANDKDSERSGALRRSLMGIDEEDSLRT